MPRIRSLATAVLVVGACGCAASRDAPVAPPSATPVATAIAASPVVLVTIDGARWQDVLATDGPMPTLHRMGTEEGAVIGADPHASIRASGPNFVSLPGYTEILTGAPSSTCIDNECPQTTVPTLLDRAADAGLSVAAFSSWERLYRVVSARPGRFVVSAGRDHAYRPDADTAELALDWLERQRPDVLFLALGDTDEEAHRGSVEGYRRALVRADGILARLSSTLERMGDRGRATHVFVTADHGRAKDFRSHGRESPESARVWLFASGPHIHARGSSASPHARRLADVAPTLAKILGLGRARSTKGEVIDELFGSPEDVLVLHDAR